MLKNIDLVLQEQQQSFVGAAIKITRGNETIWQFSVLSSHQGAERPPSALGYVGREDVVLLADDPELDLAVLRVAPHRQLHLVHRNDLQVLRLFMLYE